MVKFLINKPIAVSMVFIILMVLGIISLRYIPVSLMPEVDIPEITVRISTPETSVNEVEERYTTPIRRQLLQVNHIRDIKSTSYNNKAYIKIYLTYGTNLQYAYLDVNEKVDAIMQGMPREFERPKVIKASATDIPAFYLSVSMKQAFSGNEERFFELSQFCESVIKKRIEQLPEVAMSDITGMDYPEIYIELDEAISNQLGIDRNTISKTLTDNNINIGNIIVREGQYIYNVKFSSVIIDRFDLENILIKSGNRVFKLGDIAKIGVRSRNTEGLFLTKDKTGLSMAIIKKSDVQMKELKKAFSDLLVQMKSDYPRLSFEVSRDQTALLSYSIGNLRNTLISGSILAIIIMLLFLSDYKSPVLIAISVPVSLIITMLLFYLTGISINIISLSGLVLGVGMMIDNSIIVIDNIHQYHKQNEINLACILGTNEVIKPLLSSVLTTCAVFIPLLFLSGITGALFYDQAIAITIGLFISLFVSITLLPVYYRIFYSRGNAETSKVNKILKKISLYSTIEGSYDKGFDFIFKYRKPAIIVLVLLITAGLYIFNQLPKESFPKFEENESLVMVDWNENISVQEGADRMKTLFKQVESNVVHFNANIGKQEYLLAHSNELDINEAELYVKTSSAQSLDSVRYAIKNWITNTYPGATYSFATPPNLFEQVFKVEKTPLIVKFWDNKQNGAVDAEMFGVIQRDMAEQTGFTIASNQAFQEYYVLHPNFENINLYNVNLNSITYALQKGLRGYQITNLKNGNYLIPIVLTEDQKSFDKIMNETLIQNESRVPIPLSELISFGKTIDYKKIDGGKEGSYNQLFIQASEKESTKLISEINAFFKTNPAIDHVFTGAVFRNRALVNELIVVLLIAVLLLYFILASQFESLTQPLIVLLEIPLDIAAVLLILRITGTSLNLMSLIGIIVMTGIIINDSILKIDTINRLRKDGFKLIDAIHKGGQRRLKPIIMTSLTTILALVPFLFGHDLGSVLQRPLAIAIIGGMFFGTIVSLFIVPLLYWFLFRKNANVRTTTE
ncbi:efflux RND transporter permease subunit [Saccharicrinis sp. FJH2]|uniref:efflux RND transporter permease subunit n=1 Tax=Saccharicrinis sp. FJH65 TaxID=3344659 RepID=UPI0035F35897